MINHGIITGALFLCVGMIYERTHTREIADYGGLFKVAPIYSTFLALFCLAAAGTPGLEFLRRGVPHHQRGLQGLAWLGVMAVWGVALGTTYMLWLFYRVVIGELSPGVRGAATRPQRPRDRDARAAGRAGCGHRPLPESVLGFLRGSVTQLLAAVASSGGIAGRP